MTVGENTVKFTPLNFSKYPPNSDLTTHCVVDTVPPQGPSGEPAGRGASGAHLGDLAQAEAHRGAGELPEAHGDHEEPVREQTHGTQIDARFFFYVKLCAKQKKWYAN